MIGLISVVIVCFLIPLTVPLLAARRSRRAVILFLAGVISFFISQICIRIPLLEYFFTKQDWFVRLSMEGWFVILFYAGTAGLFEGVGRFVGLSLVSQKRKPSWLDAVIFGLGHGGCEAVLLTGLNGIYSFFAYGNQYSTEFVLASIERLCAISIHIFMSVLIAYGIVKKTKLFLAAAIVLHAFADGLMVVVKMITGDMNLTLLLVGVIGIIYFFAAIYWKKKALWKTVNGR